LQMRISLIRCVGALCIVAVSTALSSCSGGTATQPSSATSGSLPSLNRSVSYGGISLKVPSEFQVVTPPSCVMSGNLIQLGSPLDISKCPTVGAAVNSAVVVVSGTSIVPPNSQIWSKPFMINGITVIEGQPSTGRTCNGAGSCSTVSSQFFEIPSNSVAISIWGSGSVGGKNFQLGKMIVNSIDD